MLNNYFLFDIVLSTVALILSFYLGQSLVNFFCYYLKKYYNYINIKNENLDDSIIFNCWIGNPSSNWLTTILIFCFIFSFYLIFSYGIQFSFITFLAILLFFLFCWNSLQWIEIHQKNISFFKMYYGTPTEVYNFKKSEITYIEKKITKPHIRSDKKNFWIAIQFKKGKIIILPLEKEEELDNFLELLQY